ARATGRRRTSAVPAPRRRSRTRRRDARAPGRRAPRQRRRRAAGPRIGPSATALLADGPTELQSVDALGVVGDPVQRARPPLPRATDTAAGLAAPHAVRHVIEHAQAA